LDAEASLHQKARADAWERGADQWLPARSVIASKAKQSRLGLRILRLPHDRPLSTPMESSLSLAMTTSRFLYSPDDSQRRVLQFVRETNLSLAKRNISLAN
jgi:hypothetical protein